MRSDERMSEMMQGWWLAGNNLTWERDGARSQLEFHFGFKLHNFSLQQRFQIALRTNYHCGNSFKIFENNSIVSMSCNPPSEEKLDNRVVPKGSKRQLFCQKKKLMPSKNTGWVKTWVDAVDQQHSSEGSVPWQWQCDTEVLMDGLRGWDEILPT